MGNATGYKISEDLEIKGMYEFCILKSPRSGNLNPLHDISRPVNEDFLQKHRKNAICSNCAFNSNLKRVCGVRGFIKCSKGKRTKI